MSDIEPVEIPAVQYLTTPAFSSNDPATEGLRMIPVSDDDASEQDWADPAEASELKAADWVAAFGEIGNEDDFKEAVAAFKATGKSWSTVNDAIEKREAGFWISNIEGAETQDALDSVLTDYSESEFSHDSVEQAGEKKQAEITAALEAANNS